MPFNTKLSYVLIVDAAMKVLDAHGDRGFSMRSVAEELNVSVSALYRHVNDKKDLVAGMRMRITGDMVNEKILSLPWDEALREWAYAYRDIFAQHPKFIETFTSTPFTDDDGIVKVYEIFLTKMVCAGWSQLDALEIMQILDSFIIGSALDLASKMDILNPGSVFDAQNFVKGYEIMEERRERTGIPQADQAFRRGLDVIMTALKAELKSNLHHAK